MLDGMTLQYTTEGNVATIELTQEYSTMLMIKELTKVCNHLEDENPCQVVVLKGSENCFSRGLHFGEFHDKKALDIHGFNKWEKICTRIERLPKVTISILQGAVIGGGFQLSLVTDVRIASPDAYFQLPELKQGFLPGCRFSDGQIHWFGSCQETHFTVCSSFSSRGSGFGHSGCRQ